MPIKIERLLYSAEETAKEANTTIEKVIELAEAIWPAGDSWYYDEGHNFDEWQKDRLVDVFNLFKEWNS